MNWNEIVKTLTTGYTGGVAVFLLWLPLAFFIKGRVYRRLKKLTEKSHEKLDDIIIKGLNRPLNLIIIFIGLFLMQRFMPLEGDLKIYLSYATRIILLLVMIFLIDQIIRIFLMEFSKKSEFRHLSQSAVQGVVRGIVFIIGALIILDSFGVNISPLIASLGIGSLAIALALQPTLANLFAGLAIGLDRSIQVGDLVKLENGENGYIEDIGWRASKVRLRANNVVVIPNSTLVNSTVTNYEIPESSMKIYLRCGVHYKSDLEIVERVVLDEAKKAAVESEHADNKFEPWFRFEKFGLSSIDFCVIMMATGFQSHHLLTSEMIKRIHKRFREEKIVIPFPIQTLDL
ncbi:MAG: mechanosensitive ion channel family protein, partial [bacterium]